MLVHRLVIWAVMIALAAPAAASPLPRFAAGASYPQVRRELAGQGFMPVRILERPNDLTCDIPSLLCRAFPEVEHCTGAGRAYCNFLYRRRSDGTYWIVTTEGEVYEAADLRGLTTVSMWRADRGHLEGLVILTDRGARFRFVYTPQPNKEPPTPLCSEVPPHTLPCWVKPPADPKRR
jgi:hypothetical protein